MENPHTSAPSISGKVSRVPRGLENPHARKKTLAATQANPELCKCSKFELGKHFFLLCARYAVHSAIFPPQLCGPLPALPSCAATSASLVPFCAY